MPGVMRQIGPPFRNAKGETVKPLALIKWCEGCGFEGATFGQIGVEGKREWWCGWEGRPVCKGKGHGTGQQGGQHG